MIGRQVRTELFYREDIRTLLQSLDGANAALLTRMQGQQAAAYRAGFAAAMEAVATAFGVRLDPPEQMVLQIERRIPSECEVK